MRKFRRTSRPQPTRLAAAVRTATVDDGMTLLDSRRGTLFHLTPSGAMIVDALAEHDATLDTVADALTRQYGISKDRARADVLGLVNELRSRGLVTG